MTSLRDTALLVALRQAMKSGATPFRAAMAVVELMGEPPRPASATEAHWVGVIKVALGEPAPAAGGEDESED